MHPAGSASYYARFTHAPVQGGGFETVPRDHDTLGNAYSLLAHDRFSHATGRPITSAAIVEQV